MQEVTLFYQLYQNFDFLTISAYCCLGFIYLKNDDMDSDHVQFGMLARYIVVIGVPTHLSYFVKHDQNKNK